MNSLPESSPVFGELDVDPMRTAAILSLVAFVGAVLLPYNSSDSGASLVHRSGDIGFNFGLFVVLIFSVIFAIRRSTIVRRYTAQLLNKHW